MQAVLHGEPSPMTHTGPLCVVILGLMSRDPGARMDPEQAEALLNRVSSGQTSGPGNQASRHRRLLDADGPSAQSPDHGFASRPTLSSRPGAEAYRSQPPYESRSPYAGGPVHPAPPAGAASAWRLRHSPGDPGQRPGRTRTTRLPGRRGRTWSAHQSGPAGPGRPAHPGQQAYQGGPAEPGRPAYRGRAAEPVRPDHQDGPAGIRAARLQEQPGADPRTRADSPYSEQSPYGGEPPYRGAPTHSGQPPHGAEPSYPGSRSHRGLPTGAVGGFLVRRPPVERIAILIGVPASWR